MTTWYSYTDLADMLRFFIIVTSLFTATLIVIETVIYLKRIKIEHENWISDGYGLKPTVHLLHILAQVLLLTAWTGDMYSRFGQPLTWRSPLLAVAMIFYAVAKYGLFATHYALYMRRKAQVFAAKEAAELDVSAAPDKE